jgi:hypothetical protein
LKTPLSESLSQVLGQGLALLDSLTESEYADRLPAPHNASIGAHYRHVLDHLLCLQSGIPLGRVEYDRRSRDPRLEADRDFAAEVTRSLQCSFQGLSLEMVERPIAVAYSVGYGSRCAEWLTSTVGRELAFCTGHAIHHYAIIRILCSHFAVAIPEHFGVAPSTLQYRQSLRAN